jgi:hypothetical protein
MKSKSFGLVLGLLFGGVQLIAQNVYVATATTTALTIKQPATASAQALVNGSVQ